MSNGKEIKETRSNLFAFSLNPIEDCFKSALRKATRFPSFRVILISLAEHLWSEVKGISKWLMDTSQDVLAGHEDL